jgi:hypothetical protein
MRTLIRMLLLAALICAGCAAKEKPAFKTPPGPSAGLGGNALPMPVADKAVPDKTVADKTARGKKAADKKKASSKKPGLIVTPESALMGKVATYNDAGRFVVLDFPGGRMPVADQRMFVYRRGLKVGEVKINSSQRNHYVVADLTAGEAQSGDEVRDK